jgi:YVTN family beta-propeller protein
MKRLQFNYFLLTLVSLSVLSSCEKENKPEIQDIKPVRKGLYVLAEGGFNSNNSALTYYNFDNKQLIADQFQAVNGRGLGDTGNDLKTYGSKMYIVVSVSSTLEITDLTGKSIKKIDFRNGNTTIQPRSIAFNKNKAFISSYNGTVSVLDTTLLTIEKTINVGSSPEKLAVANGKLYVANSGGMNYPNYDKTVSVIDLSTLTEIKKIIVAENPNNVTVDSDGDVYIVSSGNYSTVKPSLAIIDSKTDLVKKTFDDFKAGSFTISGDYAYFTAGQGIIKVFNVKTEAIEKASFITDGTTITTPYGIAVDEVNNEVFVTDAKNYSINGEVFCFDKSTGVKKYSLATGINPSKVVFINK